MPFSLLKCRGARLSKADITSAFKVLLFFCSHQRSLTSGSHFNLLAFFRFLCYSELTSSSRRLSSLLKRLPPSLWRLAHLLLKQRKTNQLGSPLSIFWFKIILPLSHFDLLTHFLYLRKSQHALPSDPLFITESGHIPTYHGFFHTFAKFSRCLEFLLISSLATPFTSVSFFVPSIHSLPLNLVSAPGLEPNPATIGWEAGYTVQVASLSQD